jgi:nucleotide-binding universal stress UspA family protein
MFDKILTPVDLTPVDSLDIAPGILPYVACLARGLKIPVELTTALLHDQLEALEKESKGDGEDYSTDLLRMNVSEESGSLITFQGVGKKNGEDYSPLVIKNSVLPAGRYLGQLVTHLGEQDVQAKGVVRVGDEAVEEILRLADQDNCDLIALATHDRNLLVQAIQGSVTNEVIRAGQAPVLAVSPDKSEVAAGYDMVLTNILVPLDGSPMAETVLPYVESLAKTLSLHVTLITVVQYQHQYAYAWVGGSHPINPELIEAQQEAQRADEQDAQRYLQQLADSLASKGISVQWEVLRGGTARTLEGLAEQLSNNMIALASHGRSGLARWVMGSVAEDLIRKTGGPVLVIPSGVAEAENS